MSVNELAEQAREVGGEIEEGTIYRWCWKDEARHGDSGPYRSYHCKSCIAIVREGRLYDTFWGHPSWEHEIRAEDVSLTFYGREDWPTIQSYEVPYYDQADIANMNHSNNSHATVYLRPGAMKSKERLLEEVKYREESALADLRSAQRTISRMQENLKFIKSGELDKVFL